MGIVIDKDQSFKLDELELGISVEFARQKVIAPKLKLKKSQIEGRGFIK